METKILPPSPTLPSLDASASTNAVTETADAEDRGPTDLALRPLDAAPALKRDTFPNRPTRSGSGPPTTIPNVQHLLRSYGIHVRYNVIKKKLVVTMPGHSGCSDNMDGVALTQIISLATLNGMQTGSIAAIVSAIGDRNLYNPVADWMLSRPWDGVDRMHEIYSTLIEREDYPRELKETLVRRWLLGCVAAALMPTGFRCRGVLTLQGPQGIGKTAWTRALVSDDALAQEVIKLDHHMDAGSKDALLTALSHWIVEIGELDSSFKKDVARLKGFLTADRDKVRKPYDRADSEYSRKTVFCATVNDYNFLVDSTGNTRFWTIALTHIDFRHGIDMQQVFAQLVIDYNNGIHWWLTAGEEQQLEEQNKKHRVVSALRERIIDKLDLEAIAAGKGKPMTSIQFLRELGIENPTNPQCKECAPILREFLGEPKSHRGDMKYRIALRISDDTGVDSLSI
jgi:putative DNA primase/helicase